MINVEIKAMCDSIEAARTVLGKMLLDGTATFQGIDNQTDTYFVCAKGRLKLREGNIENFLIAYSRENTTDAKESRFTLVPGSEQLKKALFSTLDIFSVVKKKRAIYWADNVKIHLDEVEGLGSFIEIEAQDPTDQLPVELLHSQCERIRVLLGIKPEHQIADSYSDMV